MDEDRSRPPWVPWSAFCYFHVMWRALSIISGVFFLYNDTEVEIWLSQLPKPNHASDRIRKMYSSCCCGFRHLAAVYKSLWTAKQVIGKRLISPRMGFAFFHTPNFKMHRKTFYFLLSSKNGEIPILGLIRIFSVVIGSEPCLVTLLK